MGKYFRIIALITLSTLFFSSCVETNNKETKLQVEEEISSGNFDWLLGNWKRNNEEGGKETFEVWIKIDSSEYHGIGYTLQNNDTVSQEAIRLVKTNGNWDLEVQSPNEPIPIVFNMTSYSDQEFICENKALDFPKMIKYWKNGSKINASVSGDEMEISFEFERDRNQ